MSVLDGLDDVGMGETILEVDGLSKHFQSDTGILAGLFGSEDVEAVDDVSFDVAKGETIALVGESGCGKSTLARTILQLIEPTGGRVAFKGIDLTEHSQREIRPLRRDMQMIFQDPQSSLNPRMKVGQIIEEPMQAHDMYTKAERRERAKDLLERVELEREYYNRYPHEFSGGQRQRINLARAMSTDPDLIVCDEPVSALDVSVQAQVLNTMRDLQEEYGLTYLVISHDLSVVRYIADRVAVMYLGHIAELAEKEELYENPKHPYTRALLDAIPIPDPRSRDARGTLEGDVPSPINPPSGCRFRTRCPSLIAPDEYDLADGEWDRLLAFTRAVQRRTFVPGYPDESEGLPVGTVENRVDEEYFPDGRPDGAAGTLVEEVCRSIADREWDDAQALVTERVEERSVCATDRPQYALPADVGDGSHFVGCHLHREDAT
ncbi:ATP-binding cassette domain-containing protein [Halorubrum sp. JWXQ-INN 858]|uniref:ABC transporter ATP-binding protein n=1 Tax=Halorubrum sp. JWXQ-INN 858 TaxID=2690782 RepID=UPI001359AD2D|nr:oligopeptide/dipeptide ABC transporter ATP-binding protein [Halorubrum sp. JWXQ-INN 858]MWV66004.1 ATP-binding cassette domain-containing protein [Halorubrum sp. JWXQ-INN 858]